MQMIRLTRFNHQPVVVNAHVIVMVESTPDTLLTLTSGERLHVRETVQEVVDRAVDYERRIHAGEVAASGGEVAHR